MMSVFQEDREGQWFGGKDLDTAGATNSVPGYAGQTPTA